MSETPTPTSEFLYLYCVVDGVVNEKFGKIGVGGRGDEVYGWPYKDVSAIVSRTEQHSFDRNEENVLAHQRVIQKIFSRFPAVPLPFSTILENEKQLEDLLASRYNEFRDKLEKLQEIVRPVGGDPGRELIEEALAQSFASALRIRQLGDEISKLQASPTATADSHIGGLVSEVRNLREELQVLRSLDKLVAAAIEKVKAATAQPEVTSGSESRRLAEEIQRLRDELQGIKQKQSEASKLSESVEEVMKDLAERVGAAGKASKKGAPPYT